MSCKTSPADFRLKVSDVLDASANVKASDDDPWPFSATKTDYQGWRLVTEGNPKRLMWKYLLNDEDRDALPQDTPSRWFLGLPTFAPSLKAPERPSDAAYNGSKFHCRLQTYTAGWATDMSCILFVTPMLVIAWYITEATIPEAHAIEIVNYLLNHQNPEDGGWPTRIDGDTTILNTVLIYVALRLLGLSLNHESMRQARASMHRMGGALYTASWAKFWLCLLGLCNWEGADPYPAEVWLLPEWISPWKWYSITRHAFLSMSHLAARRFTIPSNPLLDQIREEIYIESYSTINFSSFRGVVLPCHGHQEKSWILKVLFWVLVNIWMPYLCPKAISQRAEATTYNLIKLTNEATNFTGIISVDKFLMLISCYAQEGPDSTHVRRHQETSFEYLWIESQGMQVMSAHSGQIWDASLTLQAMIQAGLGEKPEFHDSISRAHDFVAQQQYLVDWPNPETCFRASRLGGWPFGAKHQGYAVSDCTAEALKAVLILQGPLKYPNLVSEQRIKLAVDNLLRNQNSSGGLSTYEPNRATPLLEHLNATELFRKVMVEYDHIECTSSAVTALDLFRNLGNEYRSKEVNRSIDRGIQFIRQSQRDDGSWLGHWGVCFTYAAMFALEALAVAGETYDNSSRVKLACDFLLGKQKADGGWGELVESLDIETYVEADESHTVQTAWSCIALMCGGYPIEEPIKKGLRLIMSRQKADGEWLQERRVGSGLITCTIPYQNYAFLFPIKALGVFAQRYGDQEL